MAIAPIDLQAVYAQMGHLAKVASDQQNGPHLAQQLQESRIIQQNADKAKTVSKAADNESKTMVIGKDGRRRDGQSENSGGSGDGKENPDDEPEKKFSEIRESYLGNHINIST